MRSTRRPWRRSWTPSAPRPPASTTTSRRCRSSRTSSAKPLDATGSAHRSTGGDTCESPCSSARPWPRSSSRAIACSSRSAPTRRSSRWPHGGSTIPDCGGSTRCARDVPRRARSPRSWPRSGRAGSPSTGRAGMVTHPIDAGSCRRTRCSGSGSGSMASRHGAATGRVRRRRPRWTGWSTRSAGRAAPIRRVRICRPATSCARPRTPRRSSTRSRRALAVSNGIAEYGEFLPQLDALCAAYVLDGFRRLGLELRPGDRYSFETLVQKLKVVRPHHRLLRRLMEMLTEDGWLRAEADAWVVARDGLPQPAVLQAELVDRFSAFAGELELVGRCGVELSGILRGQVDPLQVLFPGGSSAQMERIYRDSPMARTFNELVARAVEEAVGLTPEGRVLRVLEVGAGSGATTDSVLPTLAHLEVDYLFTDISAAFTSKARDRYRSQPHVRFSTFDASRDPAAPGLPAGQLRPDHRGQRPPRHAEPAHHPVQPARPAHPRGPARAAGGHDPRALRRSHRRVHARMVGVRGHGAASRLRAAQPGAMALLAGGHRVRGVGRGPD